MALRPRRSGTLLLLVAFLLAFLLAAFPTFPGIRIVGQEPKFGLFDGDERVIVRQIFKSGLIAELSFRDIK